MAGPGVISFDRTEQHSSLVAQEELTEMRDARTFSDFKICIKGESLPCHRMVLSHFSPVMKAMLTSDTTEAANKSVHLDHLDLSVMKVILDYMYVGQISFHTDQLSDMIIACDYLQINSLKDMCVDQVPAILQPENALLWLDISHKLDLFSVKSQCLEIIGSSFPTISKQPHFVDLSFINLQECLSHVQRFSHHRDDVLHAVLKWVDGDSTERLGHLETLMDHVQLDQCSRQAVLSVITTYRAMIRATGNLYDRLTTAGEISSSKPKPRSKSTLAIIGGQTRLGNVSKVWWKLNEDKEVNEMLRIPFADLQRHHSVCKTPVGFIISGGVRSTLCIMYNAQTKSWSRLQNMMTCRQDHGSVAIRGVLYALGGLVEGNPSKSVHALMIEGGSWQEKLDLPQCVSCPKVAELGDNMYVLDDESGRFFQMDITQIEWAAKAQLPPKSTFCFRVSMTSLNGKLYVAGVNMFACYNPDMDTWVQGQQPNKLRLHGSLIAYDSKLLLLGGSAEICTDGVEEFDLEDGTWSASTWKMPTPLCFHQALVLDIPEEV